MQITRTEKIDILRKYALSKKVIAAGWDVGALGSFLELERSSEGARNPIVLNCMKSAAENKMLAAQYALAASMLNQGIRIPGIQTAIGQAIGRLTEEISRLPQSETARALGLEIRNLQAINVFLQRGCAPIAADDIYRANAGEYIPATYPHTLPEEIDPTGDLLVGLKILFGADPNWARFAFSLLPYNKIKSNPIDHKDDFGGRADLINSSISISHWGNTISFLPDITGYKKPSALIPSEGIEHEERIGPLEIGLVVAHEIEHLWFGIFLKGFFVYPIFTGVCEPFPVNLRPYIKRMGKTQYLLKGFCANAGSTKKHTVTTVERFFDELRAHLRQAEIAPKIGFYLHEQIRKKKKDLFLPTMRLWEKTDRWSESIYLAEWHIKVAEKLLAIAKENIFEITNFGRAYIEGEIGCLNRAKSNLAANRRLFGYWNERGLEKFDGHMRRIFRHPNFKCPSEKPS